MKGSGGAVGLTESPTAFTRWMVSGPEQVRLITQFENEYLLDSDPEINYHHHEESLSTQIRFQCQVVNLIGQFKECSNPFEDACTELLVLHTRECAPDLVASSVRRIEELGNSQYQQHKIEVLEKKTKSLYDSIKKNTILLLSSPPIKAKCQSKQLQAVHNDASLFARLYISNPQRDGDPSVFFSHENQSYPPSISDYGKLHSTVKSNRITEWSQ